MNPTLMLCRRFGKHPFLGGQVGRPYHAAVHSGGRATVVVSLAGHARSGKSTLAAALADRLGACVVSFGDAVRTRAATMGLDPSDRTVLMDLGQSWVTSDPSSLCREVLGPEETRPEILIVDGLRHLSILTELRRSVSYFSLVFLSTPDEVLNSRLDGPTDPRIHPSEHDVPLLAHLADIRLNALAPVPILVDTVVAGIVDLRLAARSIHR